MPEFESIRDIFFPYIHYIKCPAVNRDRAALVCEIMDCAETCDVYKKFKEANHDNPHGN